MVEVFEHEFFGEFTVVLFMYSIIVDLGGFSDAVDIVSVCIEEAITVIPDVCNRNDVGRADEGKVVGSVTVSVHYTVFGGFVFLFVFEVCGGKFDFVFV